MSQKQRRPCTLTSNRREGLEVSTIVVLIRSLRLEHRNCTVSIYVQSHFEVDHFHTIYGLTNCADSLCCKHALLVELESSKFLVLFSSHSTLTPLVRLDANRYHPSREVV